MPPKLPNLTALLALRPGQRRRIRRRLERDFGLFCRWVFWLETGGHFHWNLVHEAKAKALELVVKGLTPRIIINEPPRFSKSEMVSIKFPAHRMLINPSCCFLLISASDDLAREMSKRVRNILTLPEVRLLWPEVELRKDSTASDLWATTRGGYYRAVSVGGQITGFGAGRLRAHENDKTFNGCLIMDDLLKAQDALSMVVTERTNNTYTSTIKNRINDPTTPIICLAQRLSDNDPSGFFLAGGTEERWYHVRIPGLFDPDNEQDAAERYKSDWSYGFSLNEFLGLHIFEGYPWPQKYGPEQDRIARVNEDVRSAQSLQNPKLTKGGMFRTSWFRRYDSAHVADGLEGYIMRNDNKINLTYLTVFADTACKTAERNDYSVFQLWGMGIDGNIYLIDQLRDKWEAPDLEAASKLWLEQYAPRMPRRYGWREIHIEDKSSGTGLIQTLSRVWGAHIRSVQRNKDKVTRALDVLLPLSAGRVYIPKDAPWVPEYLTEFAKFTKDDTHKHDDQIDPTIDAISTMLGTGGVSIYDCM